MSALDNLRYVCLPREVTETIANMPRVQTCDRKVDLYLKNGARVTGVTVLGGEFAVLSKKEHAYFEPSEISFAEDAE